MTDNNECESSKPRKSIVEEVEDYSHGERLMIVNRDGDEYYIECPECHSSSLNAQHIFGCKKCFTRFQLYLEDGFSQEMVETEFNGISSGLNGEIKVIELKPDAYFKKILYGRNDYPETIDELREKYPDLKIKTYKRDLRDGNDAHGHGKYKRYALIPLD